MMRRSGRRLPRLLVAFLLLSPLFLGGSSPATAADDVAAAIDQYVAARLDGRLKDALNLVQSGEQAAKRGGIAKEKTLELALARQEMEAIGALSSGRPADARSRLLAAVKESEALPKNSPFRILPRLTLVIVEQQQGLHAESTQSLLRAAAIVFRDGSAARVSISVQTMLADRFWFPPLRYAGERLAKGDAFTKCEEVLRKQIEESAQRLAVAEVPEEVASFGWLAMAQFQVSAQRFDRAAESLARIAPFADRDRPAVNFRADYLTLRGLAETERFDFAAARSSHEKALKLRRDHNLGEGPIAQSLNNLGQLLLSQGDVDEAYRHLTEADRLLAKNDAPSPDRCYVLANLAKVYDASSRFSDAERIHRDAVELTKRTPDRYDDLVCRNNLGINLLLQGKGEAAEREFRAVLDGLVKLVGEDHLRVSECRVNLAWSALAAGKAAEAAALFERVLASITKTHGPAHPRVAEVESYLARVLLASGDIENGKQRLRLALERQNQFVGVVLETALSERDRLAFVQGLRLHQEAGDWPGVFDAFVELADGFKLPADEQYQAVLNWKGIIRRHASAPLSASTASEAAKDLLKERSAALEQLRSAYFTTVAVSEFGAHQKRIADLQEQANRLERELRRLGALGGRVDVKPVDVATVRNALRPDEAIVDLIEIRPYVSSGQGGGERGGVYVAFVVRPNAAVARVELGSAKAINREVVALFRTLSRGDDYSVPAAELAKRVRVPLELHLVGVQTLNVAGDGFLHRLPLAVLPGSDGKPWIEKAAFAWTSTAERLALRRGKSPVHGSGFLVVADVDYGELNSQEQQELQRTRSGRTLRGTLWERLPGTRAEGESVADAFKRFGGAESVEVLTGANATEPRVAELLSRCRAAHLATHGFFDFLKFNGESFAAHDVSAALDSALVFAHANSTAIDARVDQVLTADEVERLDLSKLELLVLAACSTGLGHISAGQGMIGLLGSLDKAGAETVVSALWPVADEATALFMRRFYDHLLAPAGRQGAAAALQRTQLDFLQGKIRGANGMDYSHPRYWAPFVLSGEPGLRLEPLAK